MDSLINAAARALAAGDALGALKRVALRDDAPALALRGIAMAQLGDLTRAKVLLREAIRAFGPKEAVARARCTVAELEIALVSRELGWPPRALEQAGTVLAAHGDWLNASHARNIEARRLLLIGRVDEAERQLGGIEATRLPPAAKAAYELTRAGIAIRRVRARAAREALALAEEAAAQTAIDALAAEVQGVARILDQPAARLIAQGREKPVRLDAVETVLASGAVVIDATRNLVTHNRSAVSLATRPVLFAIVRALGEAWPADVPREALLRRAFGARHVDESHRARLRVEVGRLRVALKALADIKATARGFVLALHRDNVAVLVPIAEERHGAVLALLADGESWASSALAIALNASPRTVQRALEQLAAAGKAQPFGHGRARRWTTAAAPGFPTSLLLPGPLPSE